MYLKMTYVVFFHKNLVPTCIYVIHYKFNQCENMFDIVTKYDLR